MKGEFFILGVFLFIFGMIILEVIYRAYRRTKGKPISYKEVAESYDPGRSLDSTDNIYTDPACRHLTRHNLWRD